MAAVNTRFPVRRRIRLPAWARRHDPRRRLWQRSFFDHALRPDESWMGVAEYIFENPVRDGLVATPADYNWSGSNIWPDWRALYRAQYGRE